MTVRPDSDRVIKAFLEDGMNELPDAVYDAVRSEIEQTRQRVVIGPWRIPNMNNYSRFALAGAAVLVIAFAGVNLWPRLGMGPGASPTPSPLPSTSAINLPETGDLAPGTYYISDNTLPQARRLSFTVPAGWVSTRNDRTPDFHRTPDLAAKPTDEGGLGFFASAVDRVFSDVCHWRGKLIGAGTSASDLASALAGQAGLSASAATNTTIGGFPAIRVDLTTPDQDPAFCDGGGIHFWPAPGPNEDSTGLWGGENETTVVYVVDVAGSRLVIGARHSVGATTQDLAELDAVVASVKIEP
jgi:hypothetical protein